MGDRTRIAVVIGSLALALAMTQTASAQRGFGRGLGTVAPAQLAALEQVQQELKLSADQIAKVNEIDEQFRAERRELFQNAAGDFQSIREKLPKLNQEATAKVHAVLNEAQRKRLGEIAIQVNGAASLAEEDVAKALKLTDAQKQKLEDVRMENAEAARDAFQDLQDASPEERREKMAELRTEGDKKLMAVLTDDQREQFEKMQGKKIEIDRSQLFRRRGN